MYEYATTCTCTILAVARQWSCMLVSNVLYEFNSLFSTVHICAVYSTCTLMILFGIIFLLTYSRVSCCSSNKVLNLNV